MAKPRFVVRERAVPGVEAADTTRWLMPVWRYDRDMSPYSRDPREAEVFSTYVAAHERAERHGGVVVVLMQKE